MPRLFWIVMAVMAGGLILLVLNHDGGATLGMANDRFGRMVYLVALGLVIGGALVASRISFSNAARSLAIWLAVIFCLIAGYQFRYELQDVASRVTAGLVPASPIAMRVDGDTNAVRLDKLANGHFGVRAEVDGQPVRFLIDTGATTTVLTARDAERIGIDPASLSYSIPVSTANGTARAARARVDEIRIGSISRSRVPVLVAAPRTLQQSLLGMNFLGTLTGFDIRQDVMMLID
ncbi:TIGR02281 family clan AA aspartic protease [Mesorhizobium xinjiangense]|uniref:TIGR02281 family clan AA aspartic protease n=1 Tax=Mesorhizobium xinjiangense TaxID=2678685 RepID=UPI0012EE8124|nr:TIGR02281 family clan AA aspartic protease [Mesorhizobium xinjiangense]